jgi:hypothetical protein
LKPILRTLVGLALAAALLAGGWFAHQLYKSRQDPLAQASAALTRLEAQNQLITAKAYLQVVVRQSDSQWYGKAEVIRIVPAVVSYAIDLGQIDPKAMQYERRLNVLTVPLPDPAIAAIDPQLDKAEVIRSADLLRTQGGALNRLEDLTEKQVRPAIEQAAQNAEAQSLARAQAKQAVRALLQGALSATGGGQVRVEPYFASDSKAGS